MVHIRRATSEDLVAINFLMAKYGKLHVEPECINQRDIALVARSDDGAAVGFIWAGLMAKNTLAYIDKFCVDPAFTKRKVGKLLCLHLVKELHKRGAKTGLSVIKRDEFHNQSAFNAVRVGMSVDSTPYSLVTTSMNQVLAQLKTGVK